MKNKKIFVVNNSTQILKKILVKMILFAVEFFGKT